MNWNWSYSPETHNSGQNRRFCVLCHLEIWWMTLENNRAPLLYYTKLCASYQIHRWIQIGVTVRKRSIWVKIGNFLSCVTLRFDGWHWKRIGHLFYVASSFVHHFTAIRGFKLESQSGNAPTGCPAVREKSGKFQTWQKSGKSQGILLKVREKMNIGKKSGKSQGICI